MDPNLDYLDFCAAAVRHPFSSKLSDFNPVDMPAQFNPAMTLVTSDPECSTKVHKFIFTEFVFKRTEHAFT